MKKTAVDWAKFTPLALGTAGLATGVGGMVSAHKARKSQKRYAKATTGAVRALAGEAMVSRRERTNIAKAVALNTRADMISRKVLASAVKKNYAGDLARSRAILTMHGYKPEAAPKK